MLRGRTLGHPQRCATCAYWGGQRHVTPDKTEVHVKTLGMCNNPASPNFHTITSPDTGPMKAWVRWAALKTTIGW